MNSDAFPRRRITVLLIHASFVLTGTVVTMLGPLIPILSARWAISDAVAGSLFTAQFTGSTLGVALSSILLPRIGFKSVLTSGMLWMACGVAGLGLSSWPNGIAAVFFYGIGFGIAVPTGNLWISNLYREHDTGALNLINMSWGIGAIIGPIVIAALVKNQHLDAFYWGLTAVLALVGVSVLVGATQSSGPTKEASPQSVRAWKWRSALIFGALFFLYVGSENAFSGWIASHAKRLSAADSAWALTPSFFWITLVAGRGFAPVVLRRFSDSVVATGGLVLAILGAALLLSAHNWHGAAAYALIAGIGFAPVYPIVISWMTRSFGEAATRVAGSMFALAGFGAATMPWLVGAVAQKYGSLRLGLIVPLLGLLAMLVILYSNQALTRGAKDAIP
jgi:MFS transporter, FHS family, glucose/mannose:H+ symporter